MFFLLAKNKDPKFATFIMDSLVSTLILNYQTDLRAKPVPLSAEIYVDGWSIHHIFVR